MILLRTRALAPKELAQVASPPAPRVLLHALATQLTSQETTRAGQHPEMNVKGGCGGVQRQEMSREEARTVDLDLQNSESGRYSL